MSTPTLERPRAEDNAYPSIRARRQLGPAAPLLFALAATLIATMGAAASLHGVVDGWGWLIQVFAVVLAALLGTNAARYFGAPRFLVPLFGVLAMVFSLTVLFFSNTAFLGFIPTGATYRALLHVWTMANEQMGSQVPPVQTTGVIVFSLTVWAALVALAVDTLAFTLRAPAVAGIPLALLLIIASLFEPRGAGLGAVAVTASGFLLILAASRWFESTALNGKGRRLAVELVTESNAHHSLNASNPVNSLFQGTVVVAGGVVALMILPMVVPGFNKGMFMEGTRPTWGRLATNIDPMISLGNDLRSNAAGTVLHYYTDDTAPMYLRTSVIGNLEGSKWKPNDGLLRVPVTEELSIPTRPERVGSSREITTRVVTDKYRGVWLPLPTGSDRISGLSGNWKWSPDTGTILAGENEPIAAQDFVTLSEVPEITAESLISWSQDVSGGFFDSVNPEYSQIPADLPASVPAATQKAISGKEDASPFEQAVAIQDYLRSSAFTYSEKTPVQDGYDGSGMQVIEAFLDKRAGYCVHFASTMATMARTLNIPSRIVTGYSPGNATGESVSASNGTELKEFTVNARNAHAWPELYISGAGWIAFEPTPGRGVPPEYAPAVAAANPTQDQNPRESNPTNSETAPTSAASSSSASAVSGNEVTQREAPSPWPLVALLAALLVAAVPLLIRRIQHRNRLLGILGTPDGAKESGAEAAWAELVALGIDHAKPMRQDESAGDYARRLAKLYPGAHEAIMLIVDGYERQRYSAAAFTAEQLQGLRGALAGVATSMGEALTPATRLGIRLWPRSVFAPRPLDPSNYRVSK